MVLLEYQAVVLAGGKGSRMVEMTARKPKCLLPVGNYPMVWYSLQMLERFGFQEAIVVVQENIKSETEAVLDDCGLSLRTNVVSIPVNEDWGTADSLRHIADWIKSDVLVVSCDLISSVDLNAVLNAHRKNDSSLTALVFPSQEENCILPIPGPKSKNKPERDLFGIAHDTSRLVFVASVSDFEEMLPLRKSILKKHGRVTLYSSLLDAHLYVMKKYLIDYLVHNRSLSTVKGELLPHVVKKQFSSLNSATSKLKDKDLVDVISDNLEKENTAKDIFTFIEPDELKQKILSMSTFNDHRGDSKPVYHDDLLKCYAVFPSSDQYAIRVNTLSQYCLINRQIISRWNELTNKKEMKLISPLSEILSSQLDEFTCAVGSMTRISEKTSIKTTLIGSKCKIQPKTRITDSIIMNNVTVGEGCVIVNCVLCDDAVVEDGCQLKDCLVGSQHIIPKNAKHTNQVLTAIDRLMEI